MGHMLSVPVPSQCWRAANHLHVDRQAITCRSTCKVVYLVSKQIKRRDFVSGMAIGAGRRSRDFNPIRSEYGDQPMMFFTQLKFDL